MQFYESRFFRINIFNKIILTSRRKKNKRGVKRNICRLLHENASKEKFRKRAAVYLQSSFLGVMELRILSSRGSFMFHPRKLGNFPRGHFEVVESIRPQRAFRYFFEIF